VLWLRASEQDALNGCLCIDTFVRKNNVISIKSFSTIVHNWRLKRDDFSKYFTYQKIGTRSWTLAGLSPT
jgi:hypothetical protein